MLVTQGRRLAFPIWVTSHVALVRRVETRLHLYIVHSTSVLTYYSMAAPNNILDPHLVNIFPHMQPEHQRQGVEILKVKCTEIEGAGSLDAQLALMDQADAKSRPEDERKAIVAGGLDQCYWQLTMFLRVRSHEFPTL